MARPRAEIDSGLAVAMFPLTLKPTTKRSLLIAALIAWIALLVAELASRIAGQPFGIANWLAFALIAWTGGLSLVTCTGWLVAVVKRRRAPWWRALAIGTTAAAMLALGVDLSRDMKQYRAAKELAKPEHISCPPGGERTVDHFDGAPGQECMTPDRTRGEQLTYHDNGNKRTHWVFAADSTQVTDYADDGSKRRHGRLKDGQFCGEVSCFDGDAPIGCPTDQLGMAPCTSTPTGATCPPC